MTSIEKALANAPLVAILRGIRPDEAAPVAQVLYDEGFRCIEVPLNSPEPFQSIRAMSEALPGDCITGAGTVLDVASVDKVAAAGGRIIVTPNTNADVIRATIAAGMIAVPGVATPTEAFIAVDAGARFLKLFPATTYGTGHLKALASILPADVSILVTGGVSSSNIAEWKAAGAAGFGIGSELYRPGDSVETVRAKARALGAAAGA